ncbi:hypothetical protein H0E87_016791, partial [Populus deltoides]
SSRPQKEVIKLLKFLGIKQIYDVKLNHIYSVEPRHRMVEHISTLDFEKYDEWGLFRAFNNAIKNGIVEMIVEMVKESSRHVIYSENDFLKSLPRKLVIGLCTLFISIATMMVAFCAALRIVMDGGLGAVIPVSLLSGSP